MRKRLLLVGLVGCWTASTKPATRPAPPEKSASTGGATYGGATYGVLATLRGDMVDQLVNPNGGGVQGSIGGAGGGGVGAGAGGGGTGIGTIGVGKYGTAGRGQGTGYGVGGGGAVATSGGGGVGPGVVGGVPPTVSVGAPGGQGDALDPAIIRRYIRRNIAEIQLCYEQELPGDPKLAGKVTVRFKIGPDGKVIEAGAAGMPPVDACVAGVISTIEFPPPRGGGIVSVNYPFIFQQADPGPPPPAPPP
jgi:hypothetical protein